MERDIEASTTVSAVLARTRQVLIDDPGAVIAGICSTEDRRARRFRTELAVPMGSGTSIHQEVTVDLGAARSAVEDGDHELGITLPLRWAPTGRDRLLPTFQGELQALPDRTGTLLRLRGTYRLPLGVVARFGDGVVWQRLVHRSLLTFLEGLAGRLDAEVDRRLTSASQYALGQRVVARQLSADAFLS